MTEKQQGEDFQRPDLFKESEEKFTGGHLPWQWEEDGMTVTRTAAWAAPGCHDGCGVLIYTDKNGRLVKVEGDEKNPFYNGGYVSAVWRFRTSITIRTVSSIHETRCRRSRKKQVAADQLG